MQESKLLPATGYKMLPIARRKTFYVRILHRRRYLAEAVIVIVRLHSCCLYSSLDLSSLEFPNEDSRSSKINKLSEVLDNSPTTNIYWKQMCSYYRDASIRFLPHPRMYYLQYFTPSCEQMAKPESYNKNFSAVDSATTKAGI